MRALRRPTHCLQVSSIRLSLFRIAFLASLSIFATWTFSWLSRSNSFCFETRVCFCCSIFARDSCRDCARDWSATICWRRVCGTGGKEDSGVLSQSTSRHVMPLCLPGKLISTESTCWARTTCSSESTHLIIQRLVRL